MSQNTAIPSNLPASKSSCSLSAVGGGTSSSSNNGTSSNESGTVTQSNSYDFYKHTNVFFQTERINLPRGKVVEPNSAHSSPSHGFRWSRSPTADPAKDPQISPNPHGYGDSSCGKTKKISLHCCPGSISPNKVGRVYMEQIEGTSMPPEYDDQIDYYKEFWRIYLMNENLVSDIDQTAHQNYKLSRKIFNIKDFYENTLLPQILTQPHKFLHRLRQQQHQQKLVQEAKERQVRVQAMQEHKRAIGGIVLGEGEVNDDNVCSPTLSCKNKRKKHLRRTT